MEVLKQTIPNTEINTLVVHELASMSDEQLRTKGHECAELLKTDLMPRTRASTARLLDHICFEITYRVNQGIGEIDGDIATLFGGTA